MRFTNGVDKDTVDAALLCLASACSKGGLSANDIRYILDRVRKIVVPRQVMEVLDG